MQSSYGAGFLEEALGSGMPFLPAPAAQAVPPIAAIRISAPLPSCNVSLSGIRIKPTSPRLECTVDCDGSILASPSDFVAYVSQTNVPHVVESEHSGYVHGSLAVPARNLFLTYVFPSDASYESDPSAVFRLAPCCLELDGGSVDLSVGGTTLTGQVLVLPGYNYVLAAAPAASSLALSVEAGAGAGLEPCDGDQSGPSGVVRTISGAGADERGNILLKSPPGDCIAIDALPAENTVKIDAHCAPCCRCGDYQAASDYIKGLAVGHHSSATDFNTAARSYNSIAGRFAARQACCPTSNTLNPRFRLWPQQNFKLQVQAMVENNTSEKIRIDSMNLTARFSTSTALTATEGTGDQQVTYSMAAGQPVAILPMADASYLYFKNLNPTTKGIAFESSQQGRMDTSVDFTQLEGVAACGQTGESPNELEPCTGYAMMTAGAMIVDPIFRKIVHLRNEPVDLTVGMELSYRGTEPGLPACGPATDRQIQVTSRTAKIGPNRQSVNPCPSVRGSYVSYSGGELKMKFNDAVYGSAQLLISYRRLVDGQWIEVGSSTASVNATGESEISLGSIPSGYSGTYQAVAEYVLPPSGGLASRCRAVDGAIDDPVDIPAVPFKVSSSFTAGP